ncbi:MAG: HEXXH motif-containing putative peptide modification protein [Bryobacteraceae bacterium]
MSLTSGSTSPAAIRKAEASDNEIDLLNSKYRGFSCAQEGVDEAFLGLVAATYARETTRIFLDRYLPELTRRGNGLVGLLENWLNRDIPFETVWDPAVSNTFRAIQTGSVEDAVNHAAVLALRLSASGVTGEWSLALAKPMRLQWGRWLLPSADRLDVVCARTAASVRAHLGDTHHEVIFTLTGDGWQADGAAALPQFGTQHQKITLLPVPELAAKNLGAFDDLLPVADEMPPEVTLVCHETIELLTAYSPIYLPWVLRVIRYLIPLNETTGIQSGSVEDQFGVVCAALGPNSVPLAESFVHEASHQHLNLLCRLGPIDDGTDSNLYYSPVARKERPLNRIVVAYHAFANLLLFYRLLRANGISDDAYCAQKEAELISQVEDLESPLRTSRALTSIGRGLCDPLIERVH